MGMRLPANLRPRWRVALASSVRLAALRRALPRALVVLLVLLAPVWAGASAAGTNQLDRGLRWAARERAFNLVFWEVGALTHAIGRAVSPPVAPGRDLAADRATVERYIAASAEIDRLNGERDRLVATGAADATAAATNSARADALRAERSLLAPRVETIVSWQLEQVLAAQGIRHGWFDLAPGSPLTSLSFTPAVVFHLGPTPDLLVVAPRDRIAVVGSELLTADLSFAEIDGVEARGDKLGYSSLVTEIGGLAAYPAMVPASGSLEWTLQTISHEWLHHYLAFRPLGAAYFGSYEMRTLNETVADMGGKELGDLVYETYYASPGGRVKEQPSPAPAAPDGAVAPPAPTFGQLMRETRLEVEKHLASGDVAGAERYMGERQHELAKSGYYVRRLNTAYLSFFGAYSGGANPYEAKLLALREHSGSLAAFLAAASRLTAPEQLGP